MSLFNRKSQLQRLLETVDDSLEKAGAIRSVLPDVASSPKALSASLPKGTGTKAGLIAGALAALTAGSAGVSALRRRREGARDAS